MLKTTVYVDRGGLLHPEDGAVAIGGQSFYAEGPSGLLTVYGKDGALLEVVVTRELADEIARLLVERTRNWTEPEEREEGE